MPSGPVLSVYCVQDLRPSTLVWAPAGRQDVFLVATGDSFVSKIVVITGAGAGVGRATVMEFARNGHDIALLSATPVASRRPPPGARFGVRALPIPTDVADAAAVEAAAERVEAQLGPIDVWVNVAMATVFAPVSKLTADEVARGTAVDLSWSGAWDDGGAEAHAPAQPRLDRQCRVRLAYRSVPLQSVYCGAKFAIRGFTDSLRSEILHDGAEHFAVDGGPAGGQHAPVRLGAEQDGQAPATRAADLPAGDTGARDLLRRVPSTAETWIGFPTVKAILANRIAPGLIDRYLANRATPASSRTSRRRRMRRATCSSRCPGGSVRTGVLIRRHVSGVGRFGPAATAMRCGE